MPSASAHDGFDFRSDPPLKEFQFRVNRFADEISDFHGLFSSLGELFKREMVEQFETQGVISGGEWKELTAPYKKWKQEHYPGRKIGVLTGALRSSMTGGGGWSEKIGQNEASWGMSDSSLARPYGKYFAAKRPVIRMTTSWGRDWQKVTHTWLVAEARAAFGSGGVPGAVRAGGPGGNVNGVL
jgi:hypothetical protein